MYFINLKGQRIDLHEVSTYYAHKDGQNRYIKLYLRGPGWSNGNTISFDSDEELDGVVDWIDERLSVKEIKFSTEVKSKIIVG